MKIAGQKANLTRVVNYLLSIQDDVEFQKFIQSIKNERIKRGYYAAKIVENLKATCVFNG